MMRRGAVTRIVWAWLAVLALCCLVFSQTAALTPDHSDDHSTHCCAFCHLSHSTVAQQLPAVHVPGPLIVHLDNVLQLVSRPAHKFVAGPTSTRSPPQNIDHS